MNPRLYFKVDVYSHHFTLTEVVPRGREVIEVFARDYIKMGLVRQGRRWTKVPKAVFGAHIKLKGEFRFHINQWPLFKKHLTDYGIPELVYEVTTHEAEHGEKIRIKLLENWIPRDDQNTVIDYLLDDKPTKIKLVELQTGWGKSLVGTVGIVRIAERAVIIVRPMYMEKWEEDMKKYCGIEGNEILTIAGSSQLMALISLAKQGKLEAKVIIISNKTLQNWFTLYERKGDYILDMGYDCTPEQLMQTLGAGVRLIDEVHQDFHLNFKIDLYTHVQRSISLSATLEGDDPFMNRMYELAYPKIYRFAGIAYDRYIDSFSWLYQFDQPEKIRTTEWGSTIYSQNAFEKSIIKNQKVLDDYLAMIEAAVRRFYLIDYQPGDRVLVYCSLIDMATVITDHLKVVFANMDVRRYVEDDPYENLLDPDIRVSTLLSAGTGHDVAKLTTVIMSNAIKSTQSNVQGFGRLRKIPGRRLRFAYFTCSDIRKQVEYHIAKKEILTVKALSYSSINYPHLLGR